MIPLFWPLVGLACGIAGSAFLDPFYVWLSLPLAILLAIARSWMVPFACFLLGAGLASREPPIPTEGFDGPVRLVGILAKAPEWRGPGVYLDVRLLSIDGHPSEGRTRLSEFLDDSDLRAMFNGLELGSGDRLEIVVKLHRPTVYRDPGVPDFRRHLERQHIYWTGTVRNPRLITVLNRGWHGPDRIRNWIFRRLEEPFSSDPDSEALVMAMVLGRNYGLSPKIEHQFQAAGIYHLVVVAGFHLAVIAGVAGWIARCLPFGRQVRLLLVLTLVTGYVFLTEGQIPVTRAAIMVGFLIVGKTLDRGYVVGNSIAGAAFIILLMQPQWIDDAGFQMTFAAVLAVVGIAVPAIRWGLGWLKEALIGFNDSTRDGRLSPQVADWRVARRLWCELHGLPSWVVTIPWRLLLAFAEIAVISFCVQVVLIFFMVESFHRLSPISPLLNIPAGIAATAVIPLALLAIVLPKGLAMGAAWLATKLLHAILAILDFALHLPAASLRVPSVPLWLWLAYSVFVAVWIWTIRKQHLKTFVASTFAVVVLQGAVAFANLPVKPPQDPTLTFIDVGQGDAALIEFPDGKKMLVDGGGVTAGPFLGLRDESTFSIGENVVSPFLWSKGIRKLDFAVLTHAHNDHIDGLLDVVQNFQIGELWLGRNPMTPAYRELLRRALNKQVPIRWLAAGETISVSGDHSPFPRFRVLHPPANWRPRANDQNNDSLVLLLETGKSTALLTGDIERRISAPESVDVYKVPHHGSRGVQLHVDAPIRVISVGANNPFGHPHPSTLPALRTDQLGAITVTLTKPPTLGSALTNPNWRYKMATLLEGH